MRFDECTKRTLMYELIRQVSDLVGHLEARSPV